MKRNSVVKEYLLTMNDIAQMESRELSAELLDMLDDIKTSVLSWEKAHTGDGPPFALTMNLMLVEH